MKIKFLISIAAFGLTLANCLAQPASTSSISFQGALNGSNGLPLTNGNYNLTFRFWDGPAPGGNPVSTNIPVSNISVSGGIVSTVIPVNPSWFNGQTRYLGVMINGGIELSPRTLVTAVPYAAYSGATRSISVAGTNDLTIGYPSAAGTLTINGRGGNPLASQGPQWAPATLSINGPSGNSDYPEDGNIWLTAGTNEGALLLGLEDTSVHPHPAAFIQSHGNVPLLLNPLGVNVGIGTGWPRSRLVVGTTDGDADRMPACHEQVVIGTSANAGAGTRAGLFFDTNNRNGGGIIMEKVNDGSNEDHRMDFYVTADVSPNSLKCMSITAKGWVGIKTENPQAVLDVAGGVRAQVLQITGGADLAEHLSVGKNESDADSKVEPGMVVSIDPTGNRKFKLSEQAYDRKRVGIISGGNGVNPGLVLRDEGNSQADGDQPIALAGQVWVHADASYGPIIPGDLLTTSATPGHAMKVTDFDKARFAVLGQALTGLSKGRGWVQVLVSKQ